MFADARVRREGAAKASLSSLGRVDDPLRRLYSNRSAIAAARPCRIICCLSVEGG